MIGGPSGRTGETADGDPIVKPGNAALRLTNRKKMKKALSGNGGNNGQTGGPPGNR